MQYSLGTIEHLVCRKMCNDIVYNRLTNNTVLNKTFLNSDFPVQVYHGRGETIFPLKLKILSIVL